VSEAGTTGRARAAPPVFASDDERAALIGRHGRLREIGTGLKNRLLGTLSKAALAEAADRLGLLRDGAVAFDTEDEVAFLGDACLHELDGDGSSVLHRALEAGGPQPGSREHSALAAAASARFSLFRVGGVVPGLGMELVDLFYPGAAFAIDPGLGATLKEGQCICTRLMELEGVTMTSGATYRIADPIAEAFVGLAETTRASRPELREDTLRSREWFATMVVKTMIGASRRPDRQEPVRSTKVGRNDPCPCGSGKKYKKCCGAGG
jgi:hypothetical protein